jgi:hypothetical protein
MGRSDDNDTGVARSEASEQRTTYAWRIRFFLPECTPLEHDEATLALAGQLGFTLRSARREEAIKDSRELVLTQGGYGSEEEAMKCGMRARTALMLCCARLRMGVDLGKDVAPCGLTTYGAECLYEATGVRALNDVHGLRVYVEVPPPRFVSGRAELQVGRTVPQLTGTFDAAYAANVTLTDRQKLALELYAMSFFHTSVEAQFLTLITAVESLVDRGKNSEKVVSLLTNFKAITKQSDLSEMETRHLLNGLGNLKSESHSQADCRFVHEFLGGKEYHGKQAKDFFSDCYALRGTLSHEGGNAEIGRALNDLVKLVGDLLCSVVGLNAQH